MRTGSDRPAATVPCHGAATSGVAADVDLQQALERAMVGDEQAFTVLYRHLQPRLLRYASALVGRGDADDVTAETWLHVARDLGRFAGDIDGFRGWVSTICRNRAVDATRSRGRRPVAVEDVGMVDRAADGDTGEAACEAMSTRAALDLIATLPRHQAEVVLLRSVVGLDAATVGAVLGRSPGAVRVAAHRGLRRLEEALGGDVTPIGARSLPGR